MQWWLLPIFKGIQNNQDLDFDGSTLKKGLPSNSRMITLLVMYEHLTSHFHVCYDKSRDNRLVF